MGSTPDGHKSVGERQLELAEIEHAKVVRRQKEIIRDLAHRISEGLPLSKFEADFAAAVLRGAANGMTEKMPKRAGRPDKLPNAFDLILDWKNLSETKKNNAIFEAIAEKYDVSPQAVKKRFKALEDDGFFYFFGIELNKKS